MDPFQDLLLLWLWASPLRFADIWTSGLWNRDCREEGSLSEGRRSPRLLLSMVGGSGVREKETMTEPWAREAICCGLCDCTEQHLVEPNRGQVKQGSVWVFRIGLCSALEMEQLEMPKDHPNHCLSHLQRFVLVWPFQTAVLCWGAVELSLGTARRLQATCHLELKNDRCRNGPFQPKGTSSCLVLFLP